MNLSDYRIPVNKKIKLEEYPSSEGKKEDNDYIREEVIPPLVEDLKKLHLKLHAEGKNGVMVVLQAIDAAGKDEAISYIFSNLNPQGMKVTPYGKPSELEQKHAYLWRMHDGEAELGEIAILNRSHYEDVIATRVNDLLEDDDAGIETRYRQINNYEQYLSENGFSVVKFFFNMSKDEQKNRFLERMKQPEKQWEFSFSDIEDRNKWDKYQEAFEDMLNNTSTSHSPWYILPADDEWHTRHIITEVMTHVLQEIDPKFPVISGEDKEKLDEYIKDLENE